MGSYAPLYVCMYTLHVHPRYTAGALPGVHSSSGWAMTKAGGLTSTSSYIFVISVIVVFLQTVGGGAHNRQIIVKQILESNSTNSMSSKMLFSILPGLL